MAKIQWKRSDDGFCDSKDGKWHIVPLYCGCVNPQFFELRYESKVITRMASTQREAKEDAERYLEKLARERLEPLVVREGVEVSDLKEAVVLWNFAAEGKAPGPEADRALFEAALKYGARVILGSDLPPPLWSVRPLLANIIAHGFGALIVPRHGAAESATSAAAAGSRPARARNTRRSGS